jgi:signal peptide peptidase SppA
MNRLPFLAQRLLNVPLALHPRKAEVVMGVLAERLGIASLTRLNGETVALKGMALDDLTDEEFTRPGRDADRDMGYDVVAGAAVIPVTGVLVQKLCAVRPESGMSGYDAIRSAFLCALEDEAARAIVLDIDSPGGEVSGCFDLVDEIYSARGVKPIVAILNEVAYSAAYALASAADRITVPRTGGIGSIGIVCCHVDWSRAMTAAGLNVTFIQYGARKTDGASEKPLSDEALAAFQADIDTMGDLFVETVARNRGLTAAVVRGTEAATYLGQAGVNLGLADAVLAPDAAFRELLGNLAA